MSVPLGGLVRQAAAQTGPGGPTLEAAHKPLSPSKAFARRRILFLVLDRVEDGPLQWHQSNLDGVRAAAKAYDPSLEVVALPLSELAGMSEASLEANHHPLCIFGAGSFTEWFMYGVDATWKARLDAYMTLLRTTTIPVLAVCGSHQLVAIAFNGFSAVAHMNDAGPPVRISEELAAQKPRGLWPNPRVGEEGTYPVVATPAGSLDPLVKAAGSAPLVASHHKDMVVDFTGFTLLYTADDSRAPATGAGDQAKSRCRVQGVRLDDPRRLLYSTQFHPEMKAFDESTRDDEGFGVRWLHAFLAEAERFFNPEKPVGPPIG